MWNFSRKVYPLLAIIAAFEVACSGSSSSNAGADAGQDGSVTDAGIGGQDGGVVDSGLREDGGITCQSPLTFDAGFSSLTPLATLCGQLGAASFVTCGSWTVVGQNVDGGDCGAVWLFDTATGDLVAILRECPPGLECTAVTPGFFYPSECIPSIGENVQPLCPVEDGG